MLTDDPVIAPAAPPSPLPQAAPTAAAPVSPSAAVAAAEAVLAAEQRQDEAGWRETFAFFRRLGTYIWPYRVRFIIGELAGLGFAFFNGIMPLLLKVVLDHASPGSPVHAAKGKAPGWIGRSCSRFSIISRKANTALCSFARPFPRS